jgi:hypothetical protein
MRLNLEPNLPDPDRFYESLVAAQRTLTDEQAQLMNAKLVLLLANHLGDPEVWQEALAAAMPSGAAAR